MLKPHGVSGYFTLLICSFVGLSLCVGCTTKVKRDLSHEITDAEASSYDAERVNFDRAAELNVNLALSYLASKNVIRAKEKLNHAKQLAPNSPLVHNGFGQFHEATGNIEEAKAAYLKAIRLGDSGDDYNSYGAFLCRHGFYKEAEKQFIQAIKIKDYINMPDALENAGICSMQIPDLAKAQTYLEKALRYDSSRASLLISMAKLKLLQKNYFESEQYYMQYSMVADDTPDSLAIGIRLAKLLNRYNDSIKRQKAFIEKFKDTPEYTQLISEGIIHG